MSKPEWVTSEYADYDEIVRSWGFEVLAFDTCGDYQGDHVALLADGERRGFIVIGYGSCSGCDELDAAKPADEDGDWSGVERIREELRGEIHWEPTATVLADYIEADIGKSGANGTEWYWYDEDVRSAALRDVRMLRKAA
jgi:hypothetical protein